MGVNFSSGLPLTIRAMPVARTPEAVVDFIGRYPGLVESLMASERAELLKVLSVGVNAPVAGKCALVEAAAARLLKAANGDPAQLRAITDALGGAAWIQMNVGRFTDPELRALASSMTAPLR
jgi:hypothetical protein